MCQALCADILVNETQFQSFLTISGSPNCLCVRFVYDVWLYEKVVYSLHAQRIVAKEGGSCTDALIMIQHKVCKFLDDTNCVAVRVFTIGFSKVFDSVNNQLFANKLKDIPLHPYLDNCNTECTGWSITMLTVIGSM